MGKLFIFFISTMLTGQPVRWALGPSLSPDGQYVAYSYHGDIWVGPASGGLSVRLTTSPGFEGSPKWSPDGKWIAFVSDESGTSELYIVPADGSSPPRRITFHPAYEYPLAFSRDSKSIYFSSQMYDFRGGVYRISIFGGNPQKVLDFEVNNVSFVDSFTILIERGNEPWYRKGYRGPAAAELWLFDMRSGTFKRLTENNLRDCRPLYSKAYGKVYFLSNRAENGITNLFVMDLNGGNVKQLTNFNEEIDWASISDDGRKIVMESLGELYVYDCTIGKVSKPDIRVIDDFDCRKDVVFDLAGNVTDFAISPKGGELAFIALGDVFLMCLDTSSTKYGEVFRITKTPAPEADLTWSPDGQSMYFSSLRDGNYNIYKARPRNAERFSMAYSFSEDAIVSDYGTDRKPLVSPNGRMLAFMKSGGALFVKDLKEGKIFRVGDHNDILWYSWSPDSRWIAYSRTEMGPREDIYIARAEPDAKPINISNHPNDDYKPHWTRDGKRIFFASRNYEGDWWVKYAFLSESTFKDIDNFLKTVKESDTLKDPLMIHFDRIRERTVTVHRFRAYYNYYAISPNGLYIAVQAEDLGGNDLWIVDHTGIKPRRVTEGNLEPKKIEFSPDGSWVVFLSGNGKLYKTEVEGTGYEEIRTSGKVSLSYENLYSNLMREGWWLLEDGFYDEKMHGANWPAMLEKYQQYVPFVKSYSEFNNLVSRMLGELNASHLDIWQEWDAPRERFGDLGIIVDDTYAGTGVKIKRIIKDSPAFFAGLSTGDIITKIGDMEITDTVQFGYFLRDTENKEIVITVLRGSKKGSQSEIKLKPVSYFNVLNLLYKSWVEGNRRYVDSVSSGKFAYIHVRGMGDQDYLEFEKDIYENRDKQGLILDIRYNGGGSIHDELLNFLRRTHYIVQKDRDELPEFNSLFRWDRPIVLVTNEFCFSDAEIFPAGFKKLGLGKVVGMPTFGGVIGTKDHTLFDGKTVFRLPSEGWFYDVDGPSLENTPVEPDILVEDEIIEDNLPASRQLREAVRVLMEILGN